MDSLGITEARLETARQLYLSGKSIRQVATETGISRRRLEQESVASGWVADRTIRQNAALMPVLRQAADERVAAVERHWQERLGTILDSCAAIADEALARLAALDMSGADFKDLAMMARIATEIIDKLAKETGGQAGTAGLQIFMDLGQPANADQERDNANDGD